MRAKFLAAAILPACCLAAGAAGQTFDPAEQKYLYVEPCRAKVQSVFKESIGQIFVVSVGLSVRNPTSRPIAGVTVDLLDKWDNVLSAKTAALAAGPGEAGADSVELYGMIISADETKSLSYAGTKRIIEDLERQYAVASCGIVGFKFANEEGSVARPPREPERRAAPPGLKLSRSDRGRP
jgi:hypothetical protein